MTSTQRAQLAAIAQEHLGVETLERRNSDSLDFHDCAVWSLEAALQAAFVAGQAAERQRSGNRAR